MTQITREGAPESGVILPLWRNRDFLLLWSGQAISLLGSALSGLALPLLVLALTDSPAHAGLIAAAQQLPFVILSLPAGALVDRWDRKRVMVLCNAVRLVAYGSIPVAYAVGRLGMPHLYVVALVGGAAFVFFDIADNAAFPRVVPAPQLPRAASLTEAVGSTAELLGPALGGVIIGLGSTVASGAALAYGLDSLSYAVSVALLLLIRTSFQANRERVAEVSLRREVATGLRFLWAEPRLRAVAVLQSSFMVIIYPAGLALIVLGRDRLHADARTIGLIFSLGGFGGLLGAVATGWIRAYLRVGQVLIVAFTLEALAMAALAMASSVGVVIGGWLTFSLMLPVYFATMYAYRVTLIPDELQGRVNSIFRLLTQGGAALGAAVGGFLLGQHGVRPTFWLISLGLWLCVLAASSTELRRL